ncbi:hypothetical protein ABW19_dt0208840 [Dactylella cylindrospora]|nr:hypothetical protein ABW19_dt0208840 [Dactylella cylindrospora]
MSLTTLQSIFLVGGLGSSRYLHLLVRSYAAGLPGDVNVIKPKDAEFAVIRGAIETHQQTLTGGEDPITVRVCPASYGIRVNEEWSSERHDVNLDAQFINPRTKKLMAKNQVNWLIRKVRLPP